MALISLTAGTYFKIFNTKPSSTIEENAVISMCFLKPVHLFLDTSEKKYFQNKHITYTVLEQNDHNVFKFQIFTYGK